MIQSFPLFLAPHPISDNLASNFVTFHARCTNTSDDYDLSYTPRVISLQRLGFCDYPKHSPHYHYLVLPQILTVMTTVQ